MISPEIFFLMLLHLCEWLQHTWWVAAIEGSVAASVCVELTHYFSFFLLVGSIVVMDIHILGFAGRRQDAAYLADQLFPVMWTGLGLVMVSGFIMFAGDAIALFPNPVFRFKLLVMLLAIGCGVIVQANVGKWDRLPAIPAKAKWVAFVSLALWIGTILAAVEVPHLTYVP
jgi:hypothetical protein